MATKAQKSSNVAQAKLVVEGAHGRGAATVPATKLTPVRLKLKLILVPVDFSAPSKKALHYAREFAEQFGAKVELVHVVEPMLYPAELGYVPVAPDDLEDRRLRELEKQLRQLGEGLRLTAGFEAHLRLGRSWKEIVDLATERNTDLIIIATHGYTGLKHAVLGSVAEKVVQHAHCPVLVVRPEEHDFA